MTTPDGIDVPTVEAIRANRARLGDLVITTPVRRLVDDALARAVGDATDVWFKEELFQRTGSFKPRGALSVMLDLDAAALARGVVGVSAGNHAISLGYSARVLGTTATVVMPRTANAFRVQLCRELGATVELVEHVHAAFARVQEIAAAEGRTYVHPYEGPKTALGTAGVGIEFIDQVRATGQELDAVIVAAGGGGLTGGVACAVKQMSPRTAVYVVEPEGADTMHRSFLAGSPQSIDAVRTIADSLGAPRCEPYSYALNRQFVDEVVLVNDDQIREAMRLTFRAAKLVVEPAGAAALAALMYPLRERLDGQRVGVVVCGANIDAATFMQQLQP
ncbi:MAG: pyridoxal-phosphate dependent enzyme [Gemmatimonadota bacterium]|nr:pyridoxal-phosphate dependent enzyme [Gemmatimonadota bacterium]MDQ8173124.1 pyridoxal-phosphate dependent enzyme [Gemmatimonadota bacterium]